LSGKAYVNEKGAQKVIEKIKTFVNAYVRMCALLTKQLNSHLNLIARLPDRQTAKTAQLPKQICNNQS